MAEVEERRERMKYEKSTPSKQYVYPVGVAATERKEATTRRTKEIHHNDLDNSREFSKTHIKGSTGDQPQISPRSMVNKTIN